MEKPPDSGEEDVALLEEALVSEEDLTVAVPQQLVASQVERIVDVSQSVMDAAMPSFHLHKGSFERPNFGPQTNTQHVEANQIEYANITHHHTHYHNDGQESDSGEQTSLVEAKERKRRSETDFSKGYARLSDDMYMDTKQPIKVGTQVFKGYLQHVSGQKQPIVIKKIVPCNEKNLREVQHLVNLSPHPNVVQIFRSIKHKSLTHFELYIAMELCKLQNLHDFINENREEDKPFDFQQTMSHAKQLINGIEHIHASRIIHRDLKPENILFSLDGAQIKVSDFGISKQLKANQSRTQLTSPGTNGFRAPETFHSNGDISMKSDIYSLAITLYSMFTNGKHPFGEDLHLQCYNMKQNQGLDLSGLPDEMGTKMKDSFVDLMVKMLEYDPSKRPTIQEVAKHPFFVKFHKTDELSEEVTDENGQALHSDEMLVEPEEEGLCDKAVEKIFHAEFQEQQILNETSVRRARYIDSSLRQYETQSRTWTCSFCEVICFSILIAVRAIGIGMYLQKQSVDIEGGTLHLRSKFLRGGLGKPHLQVDFSAAGKKNMNTRKTLQKLAGNYDFTKWTVSVYFTNPDYETHFVANDLHRGFRICHKCSLLKDLKPDSFNISMTYDGNIRTIELVDVLPLTQKCFDVAPEDSWLGIIFWFDDETFELFAVNLGNLVAEYRWNLGIRGIAFRRVLPIGVPVAILPVERYREFFEKEDAGKIIVWTQAHIQLGGCTNSELKLLFHVQLN